MKKILFTMLAVGGIMTHSIAQEVAMAAPTANEKKKSGGDDNKAFLDKLKAAGATEGMIKEIMVVEEERKEADLKLSNEKMDEADLAKMKQQQKEEYDARLHTILGDDVYTSFTKSTKGSKPAETKSTVAPVKQKVAAKKAPATKNK